MIFSGHMKCSYVRSHLGSESEMWMVISEVIRVRLFESPIPLAPISLLILELDK